MIAPHLPNLSFHARAQKKYEQCFRQWYTDSFLRGQPGDACSEEWEVRRPVFLEVLLECITFDLCSSALFCAWTSACVCERVCECECMGVEWEGSLHWRVCVCVKAWDVRHAHAHTLFAIGVLVCTHTHVSVFSMCAHSCECVLHARTLTSVCTLASVCCMRAHSYGCVGCAHTVVGVLHVRAV